MPMSRKLDPVKYCEACRARLTRKRFGEVLEDRSVFLRRKYCDRRCMAAGMEGVIRVLNAKNSRRQSQKLVKRCCEKCGRPRSSTLLYVHHIDENPLHNDRRNLMTFTAS